MAKISETFKASKDWIKAENLGDEDVNVTISEAYIHEPGDNAPEGAKTQVIVKTKEFGDKKFGLNATNRKMMVKLLGDDTDLWIGRRITLYSTEVEFQGETFLGIRIRMKLPAQKPVASGPQIGEKAARALKARMEAANITDKEMRQWLHACNCEPAGAIDQPIENWPSEWVPVLKEGLETPMKAKSSAPLMTEEDIPF